MVLVLNPSKYRNQITQPDLVNYSTSKGHTSQFIHITPTDYIKTYCF